MGMDVSGKNPVSKTGSYFRNNCWWWRPLWRYCCVGGKDLIDKEPEIGGGYNDGCGLDANGAATFTGNVQVNGDLSVTGSLIQEKT